MKKSWILSLGIFLSLCFTMPAWAGVSEMVDSLVWTFSSGQPVVVLSQANPDLDMQTAYQVQKGYVQKRLATDKVAGFKAGLTTEGAQKAFGVDFPLSGILYDSGKLGGSPVVDYKAFRGMGIETEIGFVIGQSINRPVRDVEELQQKVSAVMPAIEMPDWRFPTPKVKGVDLIAANVNAAKFIAGTPRPHQGVNLNQVNVSLSYNGQVLYQGKGAEALGDQWKAALWLVNSVVEQGYRVEPGHILITGALGKLIPGKPGKYVADYGDFGKIAFEVK